MLLSSPWPGSRLVAAAVILAAWLATPPASASTACTPPFPQELYYTFRDANPKELTGVSLDYADRLSQRAWPVAGSYPRVFKNFVDVLSVTVRDVETGELLPGRLRSWPGADGGAAWTPDAPWRANRRYEFVARIQQEARRPSGATGSTERRYFFTTGTQVSPPLTLLGEVDVTIESVELACQEGWKAVPQARVRIPGITGGLFRTRQVEFWVTDGTPYLFDSPEGEHRVLQNVGGTSTYGEPSETTFAMPRNPETGDFDYRPCFAWRVVDLAGHTVEGRPVCLDSAEPAGCAATGGSASPLLLGLGALLGRGRRRPAPVR